MTYSSEKISLSVWSRSKLISVIAFAKSRCRDAHLFLVHFVASYVEPFRPSPNMEMAEMHESRLYGIKNRVARNEKRVPLRTGTRLQTTDMQMHFGDILTWGSLSYSVYSGWGRDIIKNGWLWIRRKIFLPRFYSFK